MSQTSALLEGLRSRIDAALDRDRLLRTATRLMAAHSPTGSAGAAADVLAEILREDGFDVARPSAGHPDAPAVAVRYRVSEAGPLLQFNGHLDTVHLPFVPPAVDGDQLTGTGASDMKAGLAAAVEALRMLRDSQALKSGGILLTAHDLHEAPWGDGRQLDALIDEGYVGDAALLPEYLNNCLPVVGRGGMIWRAAVRRPGPAVHEVMRPNEPSVIAVAAELVARLGRLDAKVSQRRDPLAGAESVFIGQFHAGSIYNEFPAEARLEGTRRWLPGRAKTEVEAELKAEAAALAADTGTSIELTFVPIRDAFSLDAECPFAVAFQETYAALSGKPLPIGAKPFVDDGNTFWARAGIPAITHGPNAGGAHTTKEWVSIDDLCRVARLYAAVAVRYCGMPMTNDEARMTKE
jgi:acetylornithine deacetylase/succinyl-diaminopimelate desuccinylase-like protein